MSKNIAIIENPLPFMVEGYIKQKALQDEFSTTKIYMVLKDELPHKVFLTFEFCFIMLSSFALISSNVGSGKS